MKIVTLTLNPAFDKHCYTQNFQPFHENIAEVLSLDAGGKGVNISRALTENGVDNVAVCIVGKENRGEFESCLQAERLSFRSVETAGRIRENITLHCGDGQAETRISFQGFSCEESVLKEVEKHVGMADENTIITFTGSIPKGISVAAVKAFLEKYRSCGAKIVIDSRSFSLEELLDFRPWLVKPNRDEAEGYTGKPMQTIDSAFSVAESWQKRGVENVMISLGGDGAILASSTGNYIAKPPKISPLSTIGAGDSTIAGFIAAYAEGKSEVDCLKRAVAYGTAACLREGTRPPLPETVKAIEKETLVRKG